jgi:hypothetical protein
VCSNGVGHVGPYKGGFLKSCSVVLWKRRDLRWPDAK